MYKTDYRDMGRKLAVIVNWPYEYLPWNFMASLWSSDVRLERSAVLLRPISPVPAMSANMAIKTALAMGATEILSLDVDQDVPVDVLAKLRSHSKDVVGALTPLRPYPHEWIMYNFGDGKRVNVEPTERLQKVDVTGGGCMLVQSYVFEHIEPPWFATETTSDGCEIVMSSDFYFFDKVKKAGFELYIDTTCESAHHTDLPLHSTSLRRKLWHLEVNEHVPA